MNEDRYFDIENTPDFKVFTFISQGRHGDLMKIVSFDEIWNDTFNLALGTMLPDGKVDFSSITNNGDRNKVLSTVGKIAYNFIEKHPEKNIYITGSDSRRTLIY